MVIDWSATAAWIALIVAIISPVATSIMTNRYHRKIKDIELRESADAKKIEALSNYLAAAGAAEAISQDDTIAEYGRAFGAAVMYMSKEQFEASKLFELSLKGISSNMIDFKKLASVFHRGKSPKNQSTDST